MTIRRAVLTTDTAPWAEAMQIADWRRIGLPGRLACLSSMRRGAARIQAAAGEEVQARRAALGMIVQVDAADLIPLVANLGRAFDALGLDYAVIGSIAAIAHGEPRFAFAADLLVSGDPRWIDAWSRHGTDEFEVSTIRPNPLEADYGQVVLAHRPTGFRLNVYASDDSDWNDQQLARRQRITAGDGHTYIVTPEDVVLAKLRWTRLGRSLADRQWRDVLGVLLVQSGALDDAHLDRWAADLGVADLLARAREAVAGAL